MSFPHIHHVIKTRSQNAWLGHEQSARICNFANNLLTILGVIFLTLNGISTSETVPLNPTASLCFTIVNIAITFIMRLLKLGASQMLHSQYAAEYGKLYMKLSLNESCNPDDINYDELITQIGRLDQESPEMKVIWISLFGGIDRVIQKKCHGTIDIDLSTA